MFTGSLGRRIGILLTANAFMLHVLLSGTFCAQALADSSHIAKRNQSAREVDFVAADGFPLHGVYLSGREQGPGALLLHMDGRSSQDWKYFGEKLNRGGYHVLAIDLRGHGKSITTVEGEPLTHAMLTESHYKAMLEDVRAGVKYLRENTTVAKDQISLVGASIGANLALLYASQDAQVKNIVLLSPGLDYKGIVADEAIAKYGDRPIFIAVSKEDNYSAKSSLVLDASAEGRRYFQVYTGAGHGTKMMSREPGLETLMSGWLNGTLLTADEESDVSKPSSSRPTRRPR